MNEFPDPQDYREQHEWLALMLQQFHDIMMEQLRNTNTARELTVAYLDKLLAEPGAPLPPDVAQLYDRMNALFLEMAEREREDRT